MDCIVVSWGRVLLPILLTPQRTGVIATRHVLRVAWPQMRFHTQTRCTSLIALRVHSYVQVSTHHYYANYTAAAAASINAGTDNDLGGDAIYSSYLGPAMDAGLVTEATLDVTVARNLKLRFQLGACMARRTQTVSSTAVMDFA